jgi:hypothetical protein
MEQRLNHKIQVSGQNFLQFVKGKVNAVVCEPALGEIIRSYAL